MEEKRLRSLYDNGSLHFNLPEFDVFVEDMKDDVKLSKFRDSMTNHFSMPDLTNMKIDLFGDEIEKDTIELNTDKDESEDVSSSLKKYFTPETVEGKSIDLEYFDKDWENYEDEVGNVWFGGRGLEETIVPELNEKYKKWGFVFDEAETTGDAVSIYSTVDPNVSTVINIDDPSSGMQKIKTFIDKNKRDNAVQSEYIDELKLNDESIKKLIQASKEEDYEKENEILKDISRSIYASQGVSYDEYKNMVKVSDINNTDIEFIESSIIEDKVTGFAVNRPITEKVLNENYIGNQDEIKKYPNIFNEDGSLKDNVEGYYKDLKDKNEALSYSKQHESFYQARELEAKIFKKFKEENLQSLLQQSSKLKESANNVNKEIFNLTGKDVSKSNEIVQDIENKVKEYDDKLKAVTGGVGFEKLNTYEPKSQEELNAVNDIIKEYSLYNSQTIIPLRQAFNEFNTVSSTSTELNAIGNMFNGMLRFDDLYKVRGEYEDNGFLSTWNNALKGWSQGVVNRDMVNIAYGITDINDEEQLADVAKTVAEENAYQKGILTSRTWEKYSTAKTVREKMEILQTNPGEVLTSLFANSFSMFLSTGKRIVLPMIGGSVAVGGTLGLAGGPFAEITVPAGMLTGLKYGLASWQALTAFNMEMGSAFSEELTKAGYDLTDADSVVEGLKNETVVSNSIERGRKRGLPIAAMQLIGAKVAGAFVNPLATTGKQVAKQFAKGMLIEPLFEGSGEAFAQLNADGKLIGTEIMDEMIGGMPGSQSNIAVTYAFNQLTNQQTKIAKKMQNIDFVADNNFGLENTKAFANRLYKKNKINKQQYDQILENANVVDQTNSLLRNSPSYVSGRNKSNARRRISDLIEHKKLLESYLSEGKDVKKELSIVEGEINEIARTGKVLQKSDVITENDVKQLFKRNIDSGLNFINKRLGRDSYKSLILNEEQRKKLQKEDKSLYKKILEVERKYGKSAGQLLEHEGQNYIIADTDAISKSFDPTVNDTSGFSVMSHEILHVVLDAAFDESQVKQIGVELENYLLEADEAKISKQSKNRILARLKNYEKTYGVKDKRYYQEVFTVLSDEIQNENIDYNRQDKSFWNKIGNYINDFVSNNKNEFDENFRNSFNIKTGEQAFKFVSDYNKVFDKKTRRSKNNIISKSPNKEDNERLSQQVNTNDLKNVFDKFTGPAENRKFKTKEEFSGKPILDKEGKVLKYEIQPAMEFWNGLMQIEQENTLDGSIINALGSTYVDMNPGSVQQVKTLIGERYRKNFDASKNSLFGYLFGKNKSGQNIIQLAAGDLQNKNKKQVDTISADLKIGTEQNSRSIADDIVSKELSPEELADIALLQEGLEENKEQTSRIAKKLNLTDDNIKEIRGYVKEFLLKDDKPSMNNNTKQFFTELIDYTTGIANKPERASTVIKSKLPKNANLRSFLEEMAEDFLALNRVDPAVMRRAKLKGLFYELEIKNMSPTQTQKAIDDGRVPVTTPLDSGTDLFKTLNPTPAKIVDNLMAIRVDSLKRKLQKLLAEVIVKNEFNEVVEEISGDLKNKEDVKLGLPKLKDLISRPDGVKLSTTPWTLGNREVTNFEALNEVGSKYLNSSKTQVNSKFVDNYDKFKKEVTLELSKYKKDKKSLKMENNQIFEVFASLKLLKMFPDLKLSDKLTKGNDNTGYGDLTVTDQNGEKINIEIKLDRKARMGEGNIGYNIQDKTIFSRKDSLDQETLDIALQQIKKVQPNFDLFKVLKEIEDYLGFNTTDPNNKSNITYEQIQKIKKDIIPSRTQTIVGVKQNGVEDIVSHYSKKNVDYIYIGDSGLYHITEDKSNLGTNKFDADSKVDIKLRGRLAAQPNKPAPYYITMTHSLQPNSLTEAAVFSKPISNSIDNAKKVNLKEIPNKEFGINNFMSPEIVLNTIVNKSKQLRQDELDNDVRFSKPLSKDFNKIIENTTGIAADKTFSKAKAQVMGSNKGKFKFFIPYSAEDFIGLIYPTLSKGKLGDSQMAWYKRYVLNPYTRALENLSTDRLQLIQDFKALKKGLDVPKDLKKVNDNGFTNEQAVRVYLFNKMGDTIPGLSKEDLNELLSAVESDGKLKAFADAILASTKEDGYVKPTENWLIGTITTDLIELINTTKRSKYLTEWQANVDDIYSQENLNKLEAIYGTKYVEALKSILSRMKTGKNRAATGSRLSNRILDYINGSVGAVMFFNTRSAILQTISSINFVNWSFNNPLKAGQAFANQKQYWKDFMTLINSDYLVDRRNGLKINISESEIADAAATSKNKAKAALNYILQKGFLPTQYADSFAIASGGATFYRNRIKDLVSNGLTESEAKKQALIEFRQIAETSQQSSDPSKISQQQSSDIGRLLLAFANTPMQYARIQKRAIQDLINRRGDDKANISKVIYYGFVQNLIFNALQQAINVLAFGDEDETEKSKKEKKEKNYKVANGMLDSTLRGLGVGGQAVSVGKNFLMDIYERSGRSRPEYVDSVWELIRMSPPIYSKISKLKSAAWYFDSKKRRQKIESEGISLGSDLWKAMAKVITATTNLPLDRVYSKIDNISAAMQEDLDVWERLAMLGGWPEWQIKPDDKKQDNSLVNDNGKLKLKPLKLKDRKLK